MKIKVISLFILGIVLSSISSFIIGYGYKTTQEFQFRDDSPNWDSVMINYKSLDEMRNDPLAKQIISRLGVDDLPTGDIQYKNYIFERIIRTKTGETDIFVYRWNGNGWDKLQ